MKQEKITTWYELLNSNDVQERTKKIIRAFFFPYGISITKYFFNCDLIKNPHKKYNSECENKISPALYFFLVFDHKKPQGYPDWFLAAFPDVLKWATEDNWEEVVSYLEQNISEEDFMEDNHIRFDHLETIIDMYIAKTNQTLDMSINREWYFPGSEEMLQNIQTTMQRQRGE